MDVSSRSPARTRSGATRAAASSQIHPMDATRCTGRGGGPRAGQGAGASAGHGLDGQTPSKIAKKNAAPSGLRGGGGEEVEVEEHEVEEEPKHEQEHEQEMYVLLAGYVYCARAGVARLHAGVALEAGRCRLALSKPALKARLVSAISA